MRIFKPPAHEVVIRICAGQWPGDRAWFRIDCKLNALQNARITDVQGQLTVKGRDTCCEAGDSYRRFICITRPRELRKNHEHGPDDDY